MGNPVLTDTTLVAIVRDEVENPAGGIVRFIDSTVPRVQQAIIVDTGSLDGTRQLLEELQAKYPNLQVYDYAFDGFAGSRNYGMEYVNTSWMFVMDADEHITDDSIAKLAELQHEKGNSHLLGFNLKIRSVYPDKADYVGTNNMNPRLFRALPGIHYKFPVFEVLFDQNAPVLNRRHDLMDTDAEMLHFQPAHEAIQKKREELYAPITKFHSGLAVNAKPEGLFAPPSIHPGFSEWKQYNSKRDFYN